MVGFMGSKDVGADKSRRVIRVVDEDAGIEYVVSNPVVVDGCYVVSFNNKFYISLPPSMNSVWRALYRRGSRSRNLKLFIYVKDSD
jgi:hypothetical protein